MIKLINDLMDVAKIDEGKFEIELEPTQLENIVADVVKEVVPLAKEKNVSLSYDYPSKPLAPVKINRQRVAQVIQNLIDNAIKYSSVGDKGTVKVELHDNIDVLEFTVKDNGIGIPENEQGKMFQRFSRAPTPPNLIRAAAADLDFISPRRSWSSAAARFGLNPRKTRVQLFTLHFPMINS